MNPIDQHKAAVHAYYGSSVSSRHLSKQKRAHKKCALQGYAYQTIQMITAWALRLRLAMCRQSGCPG